jgi:hypothetical protein
MFRFIPNLDVCMTASLTCPRHKYACVVSSFSWLDRRTHLAGRPSLDVHPTISTTLGIQGILYIELYMNIPTGKTYHIHCSKLIFCTMCSHVLNYLFSSIYIHIRSPLTSHCSSTSPSSLHERHAEIIIRAPDIRTRVLIVI